MNYRTGGDKRLFEVAYSCYNEVVQGQKMFFCGGGNRKIDTPSKGVLLMVVIFVNWL